MPEEITPHAEPIANTGGPEWFPPAEDDSEAVTHVEQAPAPQNIRAIFYGGDGLRAGWSILLFVLIFVGIGLAVAGILRASHYSPRLKPGAEQPAVIMVVAEGINFAAVALSAFLVSRVEKRRFPKYGLGNPERRIGQFAIGMLWGFVLLSLLVGVLWKTGLLVFTGKLLAGAAVLQWGALWLLAFLFVGLFEEYLTRGFLQFTLARGIAGMAGSAGMGERSRRVLGFWTTALFFSFIFGLGHKNNPGESSIGLLSAGLIGLVFAFSLWRTGSLWWAVGFHAAWDWAQSFVYGVADSGTMVQHHLMASHPTGTPMMSGGLTGPEGSIYILGIIALTAVVIALTLPSQPGSPSDPNYTANA